MNIVISGSTGYLGSHLVKSLLKKNNNIFFISSKNNKSQNNYNYNDIDNILKNELILNYGIDIFIISAGFNNVESNFNYNQALEFKINHLRKINKIAKKIIIKKIIYLSSIHVYSNNLINKINERSIIKNKNNKYAIIHYKSEKYLFSNFKNSNKIVLRLSNVFGYNNKTPKGRLYLANNFLLQAKKYKSIKINSEVNFQRDFITMDYFLKSFLFVCNSKKINNEIINITSGRSISLQSLANKIKNLYFKKYSKNIKIFSNFKNENINAFYIDSKLRTKYGFNFKQNISKEINKFFNLY